MVLQSVLWLARAQDGPSPDIVAPPADSDEAAPSSPATDTVSAIANQVFPATSSISTIDIIIGVVAALIAAGIFWVLKNALYNHLIGKRVPPASAKSASWAFFAFLLATGWTAIAGFVGGAWTSIPFLAGGGGLILVTLVFFLISYASASRKAT